MFMLLNNQSIACLMPIKVSVSYTWYNFTLEVVITAMHLLPLKYEMREVNSMFLSTAFVYS